VSDEPLTDLTDRDLLLRIARELRTIRENLSTAIFAMREAEGEIPEKMRRFANYFHDVVHIKGEYHSLGLTCPPYIDREMERCADRFRHLLDDLHTDGGTFEQVRRDMAARPGNVYDHTRQLEKPK
jgi:hypothetical protein